MIGQLNSVEDAPDPGGRFLTWMRRPRIRYVLLSIVVGSAYFVGGKAGLFLAVNNPSVSAVWPPTGIAIAALILGGSEFWPAVFVGAFVVNLTTTWDLGSTLGIASGNTLEALVGSYLANRFASGRNLLDSPRSVLTFAALSGLAASAIAATVGSASLILAHLAHGQSFVSLWTPWWLGDAIGAIELTPLILAVAQFLSKHAGFLPERRWPERAALGVIVVAIALVVFARNPPILIDGSPLVFLVVLPSVWAAFRFGPLGAVSAVSTISVIAIVATVTGSGPFALLPPDISLLALRIFIGSLGLTALLVASDVVEHRRLENALFRIRKEPQQTVQARTAGLDAVKSIAQVGNWTFDFATRKLVWSDEMYRIFGYGDQRFPIELDGFLCRLDTEDRAIFVSELSDASESPTQSNSHIAERTLHLALPGGFRRTIRSRLQVAEVLNSRASRVAGTVQDITDRAALEEEPRRLRSLEDAQPPNTSVSGNRFPVEVEWCKGTAAGVVR